MLASGEYAPAPGAAVAAHLAGYRFRYGNEKDMQEGVATALAAWPVTHRREVALGKRDIIDFLLADGVGIETKIARRAADGDVLRQLDRYAKHRSVLALVLVTDRSQLARQPHIIQGKPLYVLKLRSGIL